MARILPVMEEESLYLVGNIPKKTLSQSGIVDRQIALFLCPSDSISYRGPRNNRGNLPEFLVGLTNYQAVEGANWGHDASQGLTDIGTDWSNQGANGSWDGQDHGDGIMFRTDYRIQRSTRNVTDGLSRTFLLGENLPEKNAWCSWLYANNTYGTCAIPPNVMPIEGSDYSPLHWPNVAGFRSDHPGGLNFAYADGSVHFIADTIDLATYRAMVTLAGRESVQAE